MQVAGALPRVIGDIDVTFNDVLPTDAADEMRYRVSHCVDVSRCARYRLGQHLTMRVIDACRQVACFSYGG